jgi:peptidoglycan/xylan/chitin deacetylase (PgdA/CDA1 family)
MMQQARNATRWLIGGAAAGLGLPAWHAARRRLGGRWGIILAYHRVIPPEETGSPYRMGMGSDLFEAQVRWLAARYSVVSMEEFLRWHAAGRTPTEDLIVLTFDDGYRDNLTHAAPLLKMLGLHAIFYVTSSGLTERMPFWPETLAQMIVMTKAQSFAAEIDPLRTGAPPAERPLATPAQRRESCLRLIAELRTLPMIRIAAAMGKLAERLGVDPARASESAPRLLDADDVRSLSSDGFTIGSHSVSHPYLPAEEIEVQRREIEESKRVLEETIRSPVADFCYPGGGHDERSRSLVREAGYRSAVTWSPGVAGPADDPYALPRKGIGSALATGPSGRFSPAMMEAEISGFVSALVRRKSRPR